MTYLAAKRFQTRFPGPFHIRRSTDGVDKTFDVYCLATLRDVVTLYFWEAESERYREAMTIASALNSLLHSDLVLSGEADHLTSYLSEFPGPYRIRPQTCGYRGPIWEIYAGSDEHGLVQCSRQLLDFDSLIVGLTVCHALNIADRHLPRSHRTESERSGEMLPF